MGEIKSTQASLSQNENHGWTVKANYTWHELFAVDRDMTTATLMVAKSFGYGSLPDMEPTSNLVVACGFGGTHSRELMRSRKVVAQTQWECRLIRPSHS
jgi:hypothetical protein